MTISREKWVGVWDFTLAGPRRVVAAGWAGPGSRAPLRRAAATLLVIAIVLVTILAIVPIILLGVMIGVLAGAVMLARAGARALGRRFPTLGRILPRRDGRENVRVVGPADGFRDQP